MTTRRRRRKALQPSSLPSAAAVPNIRMFSNQSADVSLDAPCRSISSVRADKVESRFLAGSCSPAVGGDGGGGADVANHLYLLRFHSEVNELGIDARIPHETGPVNKIVCSPSDASLVITTTTTTTTMATTTATGAAAATLWKIPRSILDSHERHSSSLYDEDDGASSVNSSSPSSTTMDALATLQCDSHEVSDVVWGDSSTSYDGGSSSATTGEVVTLERNGVLTQWDVSMGTAHSTRQIRTTGTSDDSGTGRPLRRCLFPPRVALDPHAASVGDAAAVSMGSVVHIVDWRTTTTESSLTIPTGTVDRISAPHRGSIVTSLDYNPNKPYVLATSGQDGLLKFFDLRLAKRPILVGRGGHSHWVWNVRYNPFHDQLVLSTGTDSLVNLWRVSTISSAPLLTLDDDDDGYDDNDDGANELGGAMGRRATSMGSTTTTTAFDGDGSAPMLEASAPNVRVSKYDHGSESVYGCAWGSGADAWIYATVSYDGLVALNHVPSKEKYKILL